MSSTRRRRHRRRRRLAGPTGEADDPWARESVRAQRQRCRPNPNGEHMQTLPCDDAGGGANTIAGASARPIGARESSLASESRPFGLCPSPWRASCAHPAYGRSTGASHRLAPLVDCARVRAGGWREARQGSRSSPWQRPAVGRALPQRTAGATPATRYARPTLRCGPTGAGVAFPGGSQRQRPTAGRERRSTA